VYFDNDIVKRGRSEYVKTKTLRATIVPKNVTITLKNLFGGDPVLGKLKSYKFIVN
jgi:hypothetical protein